MMKKLLALLLVSTMVLGVPTAAFAGEEAGFDEYELGTEGEQDVDFTLQRSIALSHCM